MKSSQEIQFPNSEWLFLDFGFCIISPLIFHQSSTSWSFLNTELPEDFITGITFKIQARIDGENNVLRHGRRNSPGHPLRNK